jgi:hypothetical protein
MMPNILFAKDFTAMINICTISTFLISVVVNPDNFSKLTTVGIWEMGDLMMGRRWSEVKVYKINF